jgi:cation/acetate symporter
MSSEMYERMRVNPKFLALVSRRGRFAWAMAVTVLALYYGFVLVVAFAPGAIGRPVVAGSTLAVGVAVGLFIFVFCWFLMALYVRRANGEFDQLTAEIVRDAKEAQP